MKNRWKIPKKSSVVGLMDLKLAENLVGIAGFVLDGLEINSEAEKDFRI